MILLSRSTSALCHRDVMLTLTPYTSAIMIARINADA